MEVLFSAVENNDEELTAQVAKDIEDAKANGVVDTETITTSFIGYAPYDNPKMSIVVISPDVAEANTDTTSAIKTVLSSHLPKG